METEYGWLINWLMKCPYWVHIATTVTVANLLTMTFKDKIATNWPVVNKLWPIINWLSLNIFHNENKEDGMEKGKGNK